MSCHESMHMPNAGATLSALLSMAEFYANETLLAIVNASTKETRLSMELDPKETLRSMELASNETLRSMDLH